MGSLAQGVASPPLCLVQGAGSPGEMDDAWEDEDEVVNEVLADLDARMGLQPVSGLGLDQCMTHGVGPACAPPGPVLVALVWCSFPSVGLQYVCWLCEALLPWYRAGMGTPLQPAPGAIWKVGLWALMLSQADP